MAFPREKTAGLPVILSHQMQSCKPPPSSAISEHQPGATVHSLRHSLPQYSQGLQEQQYAFCPGDGKGRALETVVQPPVAPHVLGTPGLKINRYCMFRRFGRICGNPKSCGLPSQLLQRLLFQSYHKTSTFYVNSMFIVASSPHVLCGQCKCVRLSM